MVWAVGRRPGAGHRPPLEQALLAAVGLSVLAAIVVMAGGGKPIGRTFGVLELVVAGLAATTLVLDERRRQRTGSHRSEPGAFSAGRDPAF
jgi:hypothetical protein